MFYQVVGVRKYTSSVTDGQTRSNLEYYATWTSSTTLSYERLALELMFACICGFAFYCAVSLFFVALLLIFLFFIIARFHRIHATVADYPLHALKMKNDAAWWWWRRQGRQQR